MSNYERLKCEVFCNIPKTVQHSVNWTLGFCGTYGKHFASRGFEFFLLPMKKEIMMNKTIWFLIALLILTLACQSAVPPTPMPTATATQIPTATLITDTPEPSVTPFVSGKWRVTGIEVPDLASFDNVMQSFMEERGITSGALAVTYQGRLIMAHGYTWDDDQSYTVQPDSLFRLASVSKPITATAVLKLIQDGQLSPDTRITEILTFTPLAGQSVDPRLNEVTVADLLYHQGGWDTGKLGFDPMFNDFNISNALGVSLPISQANIITYMSGVPLSYDPGTKFAYSNFGYMLLGQIIETVSKQPYEVYVKQNVLEPLGMTHTQLGRSLPENRLPGEVTYHSDLTSPTVMDASGEIVPFPYGGWNLENLAAHGGWVSTVVDMARFESSFDKPENNPVLTKDSIKLMFKAPPGASEEPYYVMGWLVRNTGGGTMNTWHDGSLDGTSTLMVRRFDGVDYMVVFNERDNSDPFIWISEIDGLLYDAVDAIPSWPDHDLFKQLP
jgi:CubicO group peptidase (beta-lactamase class C family)